MNATPIPQPVPQGIPPAPQAGPGDSLPSKGGLPIKVVASIQALYVREEQKRQQIEGMQQGVGLQPGWGGQGR